MARLPSLLAVVMHLSATGDKVTHHPLIPCQYPSLLLLLVLSGGLLQDCAACSVPVDSLPSLCGETLCPEDSGAPVGGGEGGRESY